MEAEGFSGIASEWWHFNFTNGLISKNSDQYPMEDLPFSSVR